VELGALLWVLDLPEGHHHKIGMGKPLGLGSVAIELNLILTDRTSRYSHLLSDHAWHTGERLEPNYSQFKEAFERFIINSNHLGQQELGNAKNLDQVPRIKMLLKMLQWPGPELHLTEYMKIDPNEYKRETGTSRCTKLAGNYSYATTNKQEAQIPENKRTTKENPRVKTYCG